MKIIIMILEENILFWSYFYDALTRGRADAALAASLFHYKELEIGELKRYLAGRGLPVRL